ncbi:TolC family protein [Silvibacterium acidisoli]|uniref:TolC family protein n=1 Tax=Acidobacteriaceae bacterium ZG23-2 TaxID=2883246 RepID=UPI00406C68E2
MTFQKLIIFFLLLPCTAFAEEGKTHLTLADAISRAQANSPRLKQAVAVTDKANAAIRVSRAYTNPSVEVYGGLQYARPIATPGVPGILQHYAATQTIEIPQERRLRRSEAESAATAARYGQKAVSLSVTADVKHAFYSALRQQEEIHHAEENLALVEDLHHRVEVEVGVGEKGRLELTRAEAELARARFAVRSAQIEYANAIAFLRVTIAAAPDAELDPVGTIEPRLTLPPLAEARERVLEKHPAIEQSRTDLQTDKTALAHERSLRIPQPTAFAEFENQPDLRFWRTGITIPLPLFDRRKGQIDEAKASIDQSQAVLNQRRLETISALERAYEQYQLADQQATSLESGSLHAAETAVDAARSAYRFGERGIVEVLDAQRVLQSVRGDLLDAQFARQAALVDLEELGAVAPGGNK